jgi:group I intron endonuclease
MYQIYCITNLSNDKRYVGITKFSLEARFNQHIKIARKHKTKFILHQAIRKYGTTSFTIHLLEETADKGREETLIRTLGTHYIEGVGYNMTYGGDGLTGYCKTPEEREHQRQLALEQHKNKNIGMYGRTHSTKTRKKMCDSAQKIDRYWIKGVKRSEEVRKRMSLAMRGIKRSAKAIANMSQNHANVAGRNNPMFGRKHSQATKEKIRQRALSRHK